MTEQFNFKINNINYKLIKTNQYKTITGIISFVRPLNIEDFTYYSLLNRIIGSSSKKYPTKKMLSNKMYELYDCSAYMSTSYSYKSANSFFVFQTINGKFVNDKNLFKNNINILKEIIFNPLIDNNGFNEKNFNEEKRSLENDIKNIYNNKKKYSFRKLMEAMAPNDIISASTLGDLNVLNKITSQLLLNFYNKILNDSWIHIGLIGDITKEEVIENFNDIELNSNLVNLETFPKEIIFKDKVLQVSEKQDIVQAKLMMAFRYDIDYSNEYYIPLIVFNAMFGGMFGSSLFMTIRERYSLTYDISSELIINKKILIVSCGVDSSNLDLTSDLVIKEFENYKNGNINQDLLDVAKAFLINDLNEMEDSPFSSLSFKLDNEITNRPSREKIIDYIKTTTLKDIIEVSNLIKLDTIFTLDSGDVYE